MAGAYSPLLREQRNQFLMNGVLVALALVGGAAVTNERGLFVPLGIHNAISATAQAFAAIATPAGLRRLMTNSSPFGLPQGAPTVATPLGRLTVSSGLPFPTAEEEAASWLPGEESPSDTANRLANADFPTVSNGELVAANTPVGPDGAPGAPGAGGAGGGGGPVAVASALPPPPSVFSPPGGAPLPPMLLALADPPPVTIGLPPTTGDGTGTPPTEPGAGNPGTGGGDTPTTGGGDGGTPTTPGGPTLVPTDPGTTPEDPRNPGGGDTKPDPVLEGAVPEPSAWAMLIGGFALMGIAQRAAAARQRRLADEADFA